MKFKATNLLIVLFLLKVSVKWPSEKYPRERELNDDLAALGIARVRGTYTQMATVIFKIKPLKQSIIQCLLKELSRECANETHMFYLYFLLLFQVNLLLFRHFFQDF